MNMKESPANDCIEPEQLDQYLAERLDESDENRIRDHVENCEKCQRSLENVAGAPTVWSEVRHHLAGIDLEGISTETDSHRLEEIVNLLNPTDDPTKLGRIGCYEVCGLLGRGTTGIVMKAYEPRLNRFVAIKLLSHQYGTNGTARKRFEREGRAVASVTDEHVVPIYAVDDHRGLPYIVMKYVPGGSLEQRIQNHGPLESCEVARIGLQVAKALHAAHAQGIIHRDVKPANVILEDGVERAMVTDFGLARVSDDASMTSSGTISGTPHYMSPEQARGEALDARSDLFSLGSLLYCASTGRPPFRAESVYGVIHKVAQTHPLPIRESNPQIAEWLSNFIERLMAKEPSSRFQEASEVSNLLAQELAHAQNPTATAQPPRDWVPRQAGAEPGPAPRGKKLSLFLAAFMGLFGLGYWIQSPNSSAKNFRASFLAFMGDEKEGSNTQDSKASPQVDNESENVSARLNWENFEVTESIVVEQGESLIIESSRADLEIASSESNEIRLVANRRIPGDNREQAQAQLSMLNHELTKNGDRYIFRAKRNLDDAESAERMKLAEATYRLEVPEELAIEILSYHGEIKIGDVGSNLEIEVNDGFLQLGKCRGACEIRALGSHVKAEEGLEGKTSIFAGSSDVYLENAKKEVDINTSNGDVYLGKNIGRVYAQTAGGNIYVAGLQGPVQGHVGDGDVYATVMENPVYGAFFSTSTGRVHLEVDDSVAITIGARGQVESSLTFDEETPGEESSWHLSDLNGGGARIDLTSTTGTLEVIQRDLSESLGGSGLGGSGGSHQNIVVRDNDLLVGNETDGEPAPGKLATVELPGLIGNMDGYTIYLPQSYGTEGDKEYPVIMYLQGSYGVGHDIDQVNNWGLTRLVRDESDVSSERNQLLLDEFIIVSIHIQEGNYDRDPEGFTWVLEDILASYTADPERVSLIGVSRGGHGCWGLATKIPNTFAAIAPAGGQVASFDSLESLEGTSVWLAHNTEDGIIPFSSSLEASKKLEDLFDGEFLRTAPTSVERTDYLENKYVFTSVPCELHDSWTDLYMNAFFYKWLENQRLESKPVSSKTTDVIYR